MLQRISINYERIHKALWLFIFLIGVLVIKPCILNVLKSNILSIELVKLASTYGNSLDSIRIPLEESNQLIEKFLQYQIPGLESCSDQYLLAYLKFWSSDYDKVIDQLAGRQNHRVRPPADLLLGYAYWHNNQTKEAINIWSKVPSVSNYFMLQAIMAENNRNYLWAEKNFQPVLLIDPGWVEAGAGYWYVRSMWLLEQNDSNPADIEAALEKAINLNIDSPRRQLRLGVALLNAHKLGLAEICLTNAIRLLPSSHWPFFYLGNVYYRSEEYKLAEKYYSNAIKLSPEFGRAHYWMARTLVRLDQEEEALGYYRTAVELIPDNTELMAEFTALEERFGKR